MAWYLMFLQKIVMEPLYSDEEIVSLIKQNSREAFKYLYTNYSTALFMVISRIISDKHSAEDVLQETFISVWVNIHQYDPKRGHLYTWIRNIAKNKAIDFMRSGVSNMRNRTDPDERNVLLYATNTEQKTDHIGLSKKVIALSQQHQSLICLVYYKGHTIEEIATLLNLPLGTIKSRIRRALGLLRADFMYAI